MSEASQRHRLFIALWNFLARPISWCLDWQ